MSANNSMRFRPTRLFAALVVLAATLPSAAAEDEVEWSVPPETFALDYTSDKLKCRDAFTDDGLSREVVLLFPLIGRDHVTVRAKLPKGGSFHVEMTASDQITLKKLDDLAVQVSGQLKVVTPNQVRAAAFKIAMSKLAKERADAAKEAGKKKKEQLESYLQRRDVKPPDDEESLRNAYADRRAVELGEPKIKEALEQIAKDRPEWASRTEQDEWTKLDDGKLFQTWVDYLGLDLAHGHLKDNYGIDIDRAQPGSKNAVRKKFLGIYALLTGLASPKSSGTKDPDRAAAVSAMRSLASDDTTRLRKQVVVELRCQYRPPTSEDDANSQWFHAQRVKCLARGVSVVRIEGELDPKSKDTADWWTLVNFDPRLTEIHVAKDAEFHHEVIADKDNISRMRVVANGDQPVKYAIELRPINPAPGKPVVIRETPVFASAEFPY